MVEAKVGHSLMTEQHKMRSDASDTGLMTLADRNSKLTR